MLTIGITDRTSLAMARIIVDVLEKHWPFTDQLGVLAPLPAAPEPRPEPEGPQDASLFQWAVQTTSDPYKYGAGRCGLLYAAAKAGDRGASNMAVRDRLFNGKATRVGGTHSAIEATWRSAKVRGDRWFPELITYTPEGRHIMVAEARPIVIATLEATDNPHILIALDLAAVAATAD